MGQSDSELWHDFHKLRVTASNFTEFNKDQMTRNGISRILWQQESDLSKNPAVEWGKKHEELALSCAENVLGKLSKCGIFFSRSIPYLGCSPDAICPGSFVVEVKCPYSIREIHPESLDQLTAQQKSSYCLAIKDGVIKLKRSHQYFLQLQTQMFVYGVQKGFFVV